MDHPADPQLNCPLLSRIPPEIRAHIFELALTAYEDPNAKKYRQDAYYYRPGFTRAHRIDTSLLSTCRRIYWETSNFPASINEHTSWYWREPPGIKKNFPPIDDRPSSIIRCQGLRIAHVFAQQIWLEGDGFTGYTALWEDACPTTLIITLRHSDWWWWEEGAPLTMDPKQPGKASITRHSQPSDPFAPRSWGNQFRKIKGLRKLVLELETVETKKSELDAIVDRAEGWKFVLGDDRTLSLNKSKTRRTGWLGADFRKPDPLKPLDVVRLQKLISTESHTYYSNESDSDPEDDYAGETTSEVGDQSLQDQESLHHHDGQAEDDTSTNSATAAAENVPDASLDTRAMVIADPRVTLQKNVDRLKAEGVVFDTGNHTMNLKAGEINIYYIVTLTWEAQT
ncbi:MAG: hypothetical protein Q9169_002748 [Polycauliona sp. 2 TL-2023]